MADTTERTQNPAAIMEAVFAALSARDLDGLAAHWHDEVVDDFVVLGAVEGKDALEAFFAEFFAAIPDLDFRVERIMGVDERVAIGEWSLRGTFDGGPFQGIEPSGRSVELRGIDIMEFEDGLLRHNTIYYDGLKFARQIGMLPGEGTMADNAVLGTFNAWTKVRTRFRR